MMKQAVSLCTAALLAALLTTPASAADDREAIALPPETKDAFLAEMRGHMGNLDDLLSAIAAGDFQEAAEIAETKLDFGHSLWEAMADQGKSAEEIAAAKERYRAAGMGTGNPMNHEPGMGMGMGQGRGGGQGGGRGFGRFMPEAFRAMGQEFHAAGGRFAAAARAVGDPPTVADYQTVMEALQEVTIMCRGCHDTYRVE